MAQIPLPTFRPDHVATLLALGLAVVVAVFVTAWVLAFAFADAYFAARSKWQVRVEDTSADVPPAPKPKQAPRKNVHINGANKVTNHFYVLGQDEDEDEDDESTESTGTDSDDSDEEGEDDTIRVR